MTETRNETRPTRRWAGAARRLAVALAFLSVTAAPAGADIVNEATAGGTYNGAPVTSNKSTISVPVAPPNPVLTVSVAETRFDAGVAGDGSLGAGDTLTFTVDVRNDGNVTLGNVAPQAEAIEFNGQAFAAGALTAETPDAATLEPGTQQRFTLVYTLSAQDVYSAAGVEGGVTSRWGATAAEAAREIAVTTGGSTGTIAAEPKLSIAKTYEITVDGGLVGSADPGDLITYRYVVTNTGNVPLSDVHVVDAHEEGEAHAETFDSGAYSGALGDAPGQWNLSETTPAVHGANADPDGGDAAFGTLGVGGVVTFTYVHAVNRAEFDSQ